MTLANPEYKTQSRDTDPAVERLLVERYRGMSAAEKIRLFRELSRASQELALAGIRRRYPDADDSELRMRAAATRLDERTMREVLGWRDDDRDS